MPTAADPARRRKPRPPTRCHLYVAPNGHALFHADAPNDVAPSAYNEDDPTGELPASPLASRRDAVGFRWTT